MPTFYLAPAHGQEIHIRINEELRESLDTVSCPANEPVIERIDNLLAQGITAVPARWIEQPWLQTPDPEGSESFIQLVREDREDVSLVCPTLTGSEFEPIYLAVSDIEGLHEFEGVQEVFNQRGDTLVIH